MSKPNEQAAVVAVYLLFWVLITALVVCGYNLLVARDFGTPVVDWGGAFGVYLFLQALYLPFLIHHRTPYAEQARLPGGRIVDARKR